MAEKLFIGGPNHGQTVHVDVGSTVQMATDDLGVIAYRAERFRVLDIPGVAHGEYPLLVHGQGHSVDEIAQAILASGLKPDPLASA
jgi:hypothetical protein